MCCSGVTPKLFTGGDLRLVMSCRSFSNNKTQCLGHHLNCSYVGDACFSRVGGCSQYVQEVCDTIVGCQFREGQCKERAAAADSVTSSITTIVVIILLCLIVALNVYEWWKPRPDRAKSSSAALKPPTYTDVIESTSEVFM